MDITRMIPGFWFTGFQTKSLSRVSHNDFTSFANSPNDFQDETLKPKRSTSRTVLSLLMLPLRTSSPEWEFQKRPKSSLHSVHIPPLRIFFEHLCARQQQHTQRGHFQTKYTFSAKYSARNETDNVILNYKSLR